ncbi:coiled-coil domain-containing protein 27-like isoform X1 [Conger conger]|uniref:coiled-coil domain-containing protein 27-like isoform X1 n=1 Tax=Conger conger TaxID=82655 RepID=UPI002A59CF9E|nr:coiled-coil domain-containing protein 27-like isoform X1 [Conger conger]XP_061115167.1 coiled-coil domain-containing protein 27-like isoform X1 [Conger conger]
MTVDPEGRQYEQNHLPSADSQCPKISNSLTNHPKPTCRCLGPQKETVSSSCLDEEVLRETEKRKPSSAHPALVNGTGSELPWYLTVIHEKEQNLLKLSMEVNRLSEFEWQCSRKDHELSVLKEKLTGVTNQLCLAHKDEVVKAQAEVILRLSEETQRPHRVVVEEEEEEEEEEEALEKGQSLTELREEVQRTEQPGPQWASTRPPEEEREAPQNKKLNTYLFVQCPDSETENLGCLAEHKRGQGECEMTKKALMQELEDTKNNYMISTGTVCSLRRALSVKDRELGAARAQVEELKQELRDRMAQLQAMSRKFSCLREGKVNEELTAALETENYSLRQLTAQLKEEVLQKGQVVDAVTGELQQLQKDLVKERAAQAKLERQDQANQDTISALHLQHSRAKVSLGQVQTRFERLRVKIIQAAFSAPGAKQPQTEISDAVLLQTLQKIIEDRTAFHQRLQQKGEKMPPLTTAEMQSAKTTSATAKSKT